MLRKSLLSAVFLVIAIFAFSLPATEAAMVDGMTTGVISAINPVDIYVNPGGLGDALIYGYYNARNAITFIKVVNTAETTGISAKVRFREGKNSNEVLDFFICLSAGDQWTAWVVGDSTTTAPASLYWWDNDTPSFPDPQGDNDATNNFTAAAGPYVTIPLHYSSTGAASVVSADDTKEGYLEIIGVNSWSDTPGATKVVNTPNKCGAVLGLTTVSGFVVPTLYDVPNTLMGNAYHFTGYATFGYNATALADFRNAVVASPGLGTDDPPRLDQSTDKNGNGTGIDEVNFALTKSIEYFIYDIQSYFAAATTIVETFPTKHKTVELYRAGTLTTLAGTYPFNTSACIASNGSFGKYASSTCTAETTATLTDKSTAGRCEIVPPVIWDDEEHKPTTTVGFSPGETTYLYKCDEVNIVVVGDTASSLVNTTVLQFNISAPSGYEMGWIGIDLTTVSNRLTKIANGVLATATMYGMPVLAYELQGFIEGSYTQMLPAKYKTNYTRP